MKFPQYSQTPVTEATEDSHTVSLNTLEDRNMTVYMKDLQKALSACRKAENRMRKLTESRTVKEQQWQRYQREMKQAFLQNKKQYQKDLDGIDRDLHLAMSQSQEAIAHVQRLAQGQQAPPEHDSPAPMETQEDEDSWLSFIATPSAPEASTDQCLAQALKEAHLLAQQTQAVRELHAGPSHATARKHSQTPKRTTASVALGSCQSQPSPPESACDPRLSLSLQELQHAGPTTPARRTQAPPLTPHSRASPATQQAFSSRVVPFPPPSNASAAQEDLALSSTVGGGQAFADPYLFVGSPSGVASQGHAVSPPLGQPKPPKQRSSVKDAAKPTGPIHFRPSPNSREAQINSKRAVLAGAALAAAVGPADSPPPGPGESLHMPRQVATVRGPEPPVSPPSAACPSLEVPPVLVANAPHHSQFTSSAATALASETAGPTAPPAPSTRPLPAAAGAVQNFVLNDDDDEDTVLETEDLMD